MELLVLRVALTQKVEGFRLPVSRSAQMLRPGNGLRTTRLWFGCCCFARPVFLFSVDAGLVVGLYGIIYLILGHFLKFSEGDAWDRTVSEASKSKPIMIDLDRLGWTICFLLGVLLGCGSVTAQETNIQRRVVVTFDDLPGSGGLGCSQESLLATNTQIIQHIGAFDIPAIGFVNEGRPCQAIVEEVLQLWVDAGLELGNHTADHPDINDLTIEEYTQNVLEGEPITRRLMAETGKLLRYFRHPYLHTGNTEEKKSALEAFLSENSYTIAPVTIDNSEWLYARAYARALAGDNSGDQARIIESYVEWMERVIAHFEAWSVEVVGYGTSADPSSPRESN